MRAPQEYHNIYITTTGCEGEGVNAFCKISASFLYQLFGTTDVCRHNHSDKYRTQKWYQSHLHNNYIDLSSLPILWYSGTQLKSLPTERFYVIHET
jgi:hypothetical protein